MNTKELDQKYIMSTYSRHEPVIDHAKGCVLYGEDGKEYLDFGSGIGTLSLGSCDKGYISAVTAQLEKTQHVSNYFASAPASHLAEKLMTLTGYSKVFFCNSGAEANECAIKIARKYSFDKHGKNRNTIITFDKSFHGRTVTTLSATGQDVFHNYFFPFTEGFRYCEFNNKDALKAALTDDVCAVMFECIQGEGGVNVMDRDFAAFMKEQCEKRDILLVCDEVQTGVGRTGTLYSFESFGIKPDVFTSAKGLAGGLPIGAAIVGEKCADILTRGTHGSTFGANPVSCAAANYVISKISEKSFLENVKQNGEYLGNALSKIGGSKNLGVRGKGLMLGIKTSVPTSEFADKALENGLFVLTAGKDVIRILPPLIITKEEIDKGIAILEKTFSQF